MKNSKINIARFRAHDFVKNSASYDCKFFDEQFSVIAYPYDMYVVSDYGDVISFFRNVPYRMKQVVRNKFHLALDLHFNGRHKSFSVHRLVALNFIFNPDPKNYKQINHLCAPYCNVAESLEWCNASMNQLHAIQNKLSPVGAERSYAKFTKSDILFIRSLDIPGTVIAKCYKVHKGLIYNIRHKRTYKNI